MRWLALGVVLLACGSSEPTKIENGLHTIYSMDLGAVSNRRASLEQAVKVMRKRLSAAHIVGTVGIEGEQLAVDLAGADDDTIARARNLIARTAQFEIKVVDHDAPVMRDLYARVPTDTDALAAGIRAETDRWHGDRVDYYLVALDRRVLEQYLARVKLPDDRVFAFERIPHNWRTYYVERKSALTSMAIEDAFAAPDPNTNRPTVRITLDDAGAESFAALTKRSVGNKLALLLDGRVINAPVIMEPIKGGKLSLTLADDARPTDARDLAIALASGPLPAPVVEESAALIKNGRVIAPRSF